MRAGRRSCGSRRCARGQRPGTGQSAPRHLCAVARGAVALAAEFEGNPLAEGSEMGHPEVGVAAADRLDVRHPGAVARLAAHTKDRPARLDLALPVDEGSRVAEEAALRGLRLENAADRGHRPLERLWLLTGREFPAPFLRIVAGAQLQRLVAVPGDVSDADVPRPEGIVRAHRARFGAARRYQLTLTVLDAGLEVDLQLQVEEIRGPAERVAGAGGSHAGESARVPGRGVPGRLGGMAGRAGLAAPELRDLALGDQAVRRYRADRLGRRRRGGGRTAAACHRPEDRACQRRCRRQGGGDGPRPPGRTVWYHRSHESEDDRGRERRTPENRLPRSRSLSLSTTRIFDVSYRLFLAIPSRGSRTAQRGGPSARRVQRLER